MAVCYHSDTPDSTGKELPGRQQRLNAKLSRGRTPTRLRGQSPLGARSGFGGAEYEIDLSKKNVRAFRKKLAPFLEHARKSWPG